MTDKWVIITQPKCVPCQQAKEMLTVRHIPFHEFDVTTTPAIREFLVQSLHSPTTPQVFLNGHRIGGRDELREYFNLLENTAS